MNALPGSEARLRHQRAFGELPAHVFTVPGRIELLGWASAAHEGLVLTAAVDRYLTVAASRRPDGQVGLLETKNQTQESFWLHDLEPREAAPLATPVKSVLRLLHRKRAHFSGFNLTFQDDIPPGPAFGAAAARAVAVVLAVRRMFPFSVTELGTGPAPRRDPRGSVPPLTIAEKKLVARWFRDAPAADLIPPEDRFDPLPSLLGRAWHLMTVDCRFQTLDWLPLVGTALVYCHPGAPEEDTAATQWHASAQEGAAASRALLAKSLRSIEPAQLRTNRSRLTPRQLACAYHVTTEIQRVVYAERALREEDHRQLGHYLSTSHDSLRDDWRGTRPDLDHLVGLARAHPAGLGARMLGRGSKASVLSLVPYHEVERFIAALETAWLRTTGRSCRAHVLRPVDGAG